MTDQERFNLISSLAGALLSLQATETALYAVEAIGHIAESPEWCEANEQQIGEIDNAVKGLAIKARRQREGERS